ncbi:MAG: leucine-rich repeat domain-containing protein [Gemmatimonadota bacterium]|nr:leucine-rich repeat domain-containing protein [Gemmatimonadota bacterium]MDE2871204.1 leucine-rich repeat domain-containing protein [Gemmatimonadota bacterium]
MRKRHHLPALALLAPTLTVSSACDADPVEPDVDQRAVLETVYGKMNGDGWYRNDNWNTDAPLDAWHGVGTDGRGNVISLEMRANGVTGVLAPELAMLRNLKSLVLNDNGLTGSVPPELGNLQNLEKLFLSQNQLTGAIPPDIYRLGKLTLLAIYGNEMAGPISPELSKLTALEELHLGGNGFRGRVPPEIAELTRLDVLGLQFNGSLTGPLPLEFTRLTLDVFRWNVTGLCAPDDEEFLQWLAAIPDMQGRRVCSGG